MTGIAILRVIPPQLSLYMALAPEAKLTYPLAGPAGPAAFNGGVQGFEAQSFRGLGVFTSTPVRAQAPPPLSRFCFNAYPPPNTRSVFSCAASALAPQYEVSDDQDSVQMLQRSTQIGEFYRMSPPAVWDNLKPLPPSYMGKPASQTTPPPCSSNLFQSRLIPPSPAQTS